MRWFWVVLCSALAAAALVAPATSAAASGQGAAGPDPRHRYGSVLNVLPPGSAGNVDGAALASLGAGKAADDPSSLLGGLASPQSFFTTATPEQPPNFADQLEKYDALNTADPGSLTAAQLPDYFKDASLGVDPQDVTRTERPRPGVTIRWDTDGVPHITGRTDADVAYGAGIAVIETRMFLTDVLRHTGAATMAQFVGPTDADVAQDAAQLGVAPYTPKQIDRQISALAHRSPEAARLVGAFDAYIDGMNAEQDVLCPASTASVPLPGSLGMGYGEHCPVEYAALQRPPTPYTRADIVSIASLVGGIFGTGGGGQYTNAIWLQQLQQDHGKRAGRRIYQDLRERNDPEAPVTSPVRAPYGGTGNRVHPGRPGVAMPDLHPAATQLGTGAIVNPDGSLSPPPQGAAGNQGNASTTDPKGDGSAAQGASATAARYGVDPVLEAHQIQGSLQRAMQGELVGMSNALIVDARHSAHGHPTAVFGPQTGYYAPQLLMEEELRGPHTAARGVSFAGTNFVVELGRGRDYAWSATSPYTDITDTVVQPLCNTDGSPATVNSTAYVAASGRCTPIVDYEHTETAFPTLAAQATPEQIKFLVLRTDHGIVRLRTTVKGRPVAVVRERSTYMHEADSVLGFVRLNDPSRVRDAHDFMRAASDIQYTFNWYYVDDRDIAYYSSARLPRRAPGTDLDLPRWGSPKYDWRGFEPFGAHPHVVNPSRGYIANWNNKLAPGFSSSSQVWGDGSVYRSLTLSDRIKAAAVGPAGDACRPGGLDDRRRHGGPPGRLRAAVGAERRGPAQRPAGRGRRTTDAPVGRRRRAPGRPATHRCLRPPGRDRRVRHLVEPRRHRGLVLTRLRLRAAPRRHAARSRPRRGPAARAARRPPPRAHRVRVQRDLLVRLPEQGPAEHPRQAGPGCLLAPLLRHARPLPYDAAPVPPRRRAGGPVDGERLLGLGPDLRQVARRHRLGRRWRGGRAAHRLAEPADVPAGGAVHRPPAALTSGGCRPGLVVVGRCTG